MNEINIPNLEIQNIDEGVIRKFFNELPDKAFNFGILIFLSIVVFVVGRKLIKLLCKGVTKSLKKGNVDTGVIQFTESFINVALTLLLIMMIAVRFGVEATSIAAIIGTVSIAISLAIQGSLSNFVGGILLLVLKPFKVGDYIKEDNGNNEGTVVQISLFYTKLRTLENNTIILPNGNLANSGMTNYTESEYRRAVIKLDISYNSDIKLAKKVISDILNNNKNINKNMDIDVFVSNLGSSGVELGIRCYIPTSVYWPTRWQLLEDIKLALDENGIVIPYSQLDVHIMDK